MNCAMDFAPLSGNVAPRQFTRGPHRLPVSAKLAGSERSPLGPRTKHRGIAPVVLVIAVPLLVSAVASAWAIIDAATTDGTWGLIQAAFAWCWSVINMTWLKYVLNPATWADTCVAFFAAFSAMIWTLLPTALQTQIGSSLTWLNENPIIQLVWGLVWYVIGIFCNTSVVIMVFTAYFVVYPIAAAIRLTKGLYDLWPTRG